MAYVLSALNTGAYGLQVLNRHSANHPALRIGVSEDKGPRRTMEDAHSFVVDFDAIRGQGFFAVFDGHAGKHAAEWCGSHFHEVCLFCAYSSRLIPLAFVGNPARRSRANDPRCSEQHLPRR